jgi:SAM-dependent methyltransferase
VNTLCDELDINLILDLGSGQGYLDLALAYAYGRTVIGVDNDSLQTHGAKKRSVNALRFKKNHKIGSLYYVNRRIHVSESFDSLLKEEGIRVEFENRKWLLCGLHTCGDLSPASIQHFLESDASVLVNVSCCYNRLTETIPEGYKDKPKVEPNPGFPMSDYVKSSKFYIGHSGRSTACQCTM